MEDAYLRAFDAIVVKRSVADGRPAVLLDQSAFYPTGGGQPHDLGTLNKVPVLDVRESDEGPVHVLETSLVSDRVLGAIDWSIRFDHMQQHTGQHVLTQACLQQLGANTVGFHLGPAYCTIDLDRTALSSRDLVAAERLANQVVADNRRVTSRTVAADEGTRARVRGKSGQLTSIRLVDIEDFDLSGCGGTHVRCTAEIGMIKILSVERHRGSTSRVTFMCGRRAFDDYSRKHDLVRELVCALTTGEDSIVAAIQVMDAAQTEARKRERQLRQALIDREASVLLSAASSAAQLRVVRAAYGESPWDAESVQALAARITQDPRAVALLAWSGDKTQLTFARGPEAQGQMGELMKLVCEALGGRGGGRPDWAQGGCSSNADLTAVLAQVQATLEAQNL